MRRTWAIAGQRPEALHRPIYQWLYTYGFIHPNTGESCFFILPRVNTEVMQIALNTFSQQVNSDNHKLIILLLDQAGWHSSHRLSVPDGLILYPIPPYTPQLNPTECVWSLLRERLANRVWDDLDTRLGGFIKGVVFGSCRIRKWSREPQALIGYVIFNGL